MDAPQSHGALAELRKELVNVNQNIRRCKPKTRRHAALERRRDELQAAVDIGYAALGRRSKSQRVEDAGAEQAIVLERIRKSGVSFVEQLLRCVDSAQSSNAEMREAVADPSEGPGEDYDAKSSTPPCRSSRVTAEAPAAVLATSRFGQCTAFTKKGDQCKRSAMPGNDRCHRHRLDSAEAAAAEAAAPAEAAAAPARVHAAVASAWTGTGSGFVSLAEEDVLGALCSSTPKRRAAAQEAYDKHARLERQRYDELFEETHRVVAQHNGPALGIDQDGCVSSSLQEAKRFTDWWRRCAPEYHTMRTRPLDERLIHERLNAWCDACMGEFPEIEAMYWAERNVMERQQIEALGVEFANCPGDQAQAQEEHFFDKVLAGTQRS